MLTMILSFAMLLSNGSQPPLQRGTLCSPRERVYFACVTQPGRRIISLCGSPTMQTKTGYLQYRFGRPGAIELEFPAKRSGSQERFRYYHYIRPFVDRQGVSFDNGGYTYSVFHHYEGDTPPEQSCGGAGEQRRRGAEETFHSGVSVYEDLDAAAVREAVCGLPVSSDLTALEEVLPCDDQNALGMCPE